MSVTPQAEGEIRRFDEGNIAYLGLIVVAQSIPKDLNEWRVEFNIQGRPAALRCVAGASYGVPHGLDNDVSMAIMALYQDAGFPENGVIETTGYQLLTMMGWALNGHYYSCLKDSLYRLVYATYEASFAWHSDSRWEERATFRYLDDIKLSVRKGQSEIGKIRIQLGKEIVASVKKKYIKALDYQLLIGFKRPLTRALYRLLDARRLPVSEAQPLASFTAPLLEWADVCKIALDDDPKNPDPNRPSRVRRTLETAHKELIEHGYLKQVEYSGRGSAQQISYSFANQTPADPETVALLLGQGLGQISAQRYANQYSCEHVKACIQKYQAILARGFKPQNKQGFLVDILKDPHKYADVDTFIKSSQGAKRKPKVAEPEGGPDPLQEFMQRSRQEQLETLRRAYAILFYNRFSTAEFDWLAKYLDSPRLDYQAIFMQIEAALKDSKARDRLLADYRGMMNST